MLHYGRRGTRRWTAAALLQLDDAAGVHQISMWRRTHDDCIADSQHDKELLYALRVGREIGAPASTSQSLHIVLQRLVGQKWGGRRSWLRVQFFQLRRRMVVIGTVNHAATKDHLVFGQRARLIRKYVLYLTQFLCNVHGTAFRLLVGVRVVQIDVVMYVEHLQYLAQLNSHVQGKRYHHLQYDDVRPKSQHALVGSIDGKRQIGYGKIIKRTQPHCATDGANNTKDQQYYHTPATYNTNTKCKYINIIHATVFSYQIKGWASAARQVRIKIYEAENFVLFFKSTFKREPHVVIKKCYQKIVENIIF